MGEGKRTRLPDPAAEGVDTQHLFAQAMPGAVRLNQPVYYREMGMFWGVKPPETG
jgi:hypothetical protein